MNLLEQYLLRIFIYDQFTKDNLSWSIMNNTLLFIIKNIDFEIHIKNIFLFEGLKNKYSCKEVFI